MTDLWAMQSREDEIAYCKAHGIDLPFDTKHSYSRDRNLWHISHEGLELEDPSVEPNYDDLLVLSVSPEHAPDEPEYVTMTFEAGVPKTINGKAMKVADIIKELNRLGGKHGIGIVDIVENRVVGMKSRGVYETPGGTILMAAHQQLEELILDRATYEVKKDIGNKLAQVVYEGKWFTRCAGAPCFRRSHTAVCDRRSEIQAVQGQHHQSRRDFPVLTLQRITGKLHHRRYVRPPRRRRIHHPVRTAA